LTLLETDVLGWRGGAVGTMIDLEVGTKGMSIVGEEDELLLLALMLLLLPPPCEFHPRSEPWESDSLDKLRTVPAKSSVGRQAGDFIFRMFLSRLQGDSASSSAGHWDTLLFSNLAFFVEKSRGESETSLN
jgi:hypothetical protein